MNYKKPHPLERKRKTQEYFDEKLLELYNFYPSLKGPVAMLPGPWAPFEAINSYKTLPFVTGVSAYEKDPRFLEDVCAGVFLSRVLDGNKPLQFFNQDITDCARIEETRLHTGIDYDSCTSIGDGSDVIKIIRSQHEKMLQSKRPVPWWLRFTFSLREPSAEHKQYRDNVVANILKIADSLEGYKLWTFEEKSYRDTAPMRIIQAAWAPVQ